MQYETIIRIPTLDDEVRAEPELAGGYQRAAAGGCDQGGRYAHYSFSGTEQTTSGSSHDEDDQSDDSLGNGNGGCGGRIKRGNNIKNQHQQQQQQQQQPLEQSYERDSRWKPHLSWSYLSWKLQHRMEEQANQRELAWQRIADKLGPLIISTDGGLTFGRGVSYADDDVPEGAEERAQERMPFYSQKLSYSNISYQPMVGQQCTTHDDLHSNHQQHNNQLSNATTNKIRSTTATGNSITNASLKGKRNNNNNNNKKSSSTSNKQDKAKRRCMTVGGILIALIILLFTLVILMALGILHR